MKNEIKEVYIDKFRIEKSIKAKLKKKAKKSFLKLSDFIRLRLSVIANEPDK